MCGFAINCILTLVFDVLFKLYVNISMCGFAVNFMVTSVCVCLL